MITVALADDHTLIRAGVKSSLLQCQEIELSIEAINGEDLIQKVNLANRPIDVCIIDVNMPVLNGYDTTKIIKSLYPDIKILCLTMHNSEQVVLRMIQLGACGYVFKGGDDPLEVCEAVIAVSQIGYYCPTNFSTIKKALIERKADKLLNEKELLFLKHCCTEMSYKEIASAMFLSKRTVEEYAEKLFNKLQLKSRIGLALYAMQLGIGTFETK